MGHIAAETLIARLEGPGGAFPAEIAVEPELVIRKSTGIGRPSPLQIAG